jgi:polyhydroxybutyrate depolymerase
MRWAIFLLLLWCSAVSSGASAQNVRDLRAPPGMAAHTIQIDGRSRYFLAQDANVARGAPIVIVLHGGSQSMREIFGQRAGATPVWRDIARENGVLLLAPNGINSRTGDPAGDNQNWADVRGLSGNRVADTRFILGMIEWALDRYRADPRRVYVTGASNGGMMTYTLLIDAPERFAAGAAFIANLPADDGALSRPSRATPLMIMNGAEDPLMPYRGGSVAYNRGEVRGAPETAAWWIAANRAERRGVQVRLPDGDPNDGCRIRGENHPASPGGAPVVFYTVEGGGHAAPTPSHSTRSSRLATRTLGRLCRDVDSSRVAWEFMRAFQR